MSSLAILYVSLVIDRVSFGARVPFGGVEHEINDNYEIL